MLFGKSKNTDFTDAYLVGTIAKTHQLVFVVWKRVVCKECAGDAMGLTRIVYAKSIQDLLKGYRVKMSDEAPGLHRSYLSFRNGHEYCAKCLGVKVDLDKDVLDA